MSNLYQKTKTMVSRANSKLKLIKGAIRDKSGTVSEENSFSSIPEEVKSIKVISSPKTNILEEYRRNDTPGRYGYRSVTNAKNGITLVFYKDDDGQCLPQYGLIKKNMDWNGEMYSLPQKDDGSYYTLSDNDIIFAIHNYFFLRLTKDDGNIIDFVSSDGQVWDPELNKFLSGYRCLNGNFFALTDQSVSLIVYNPKSLTDDPYDLYELDFIEKRMFLNETHEGVFRYQNASVDNLSARTDNVYYSIPKTVNNGLNVSSILIYSKVSDPFHHQSIDLGNELSSLFKSYTSMIRTAKNSLAIAAIDEGDKINIVEIIFTITESTPHISRRIIETNISQSGNVKLINYQDTYFLFNGIDIKWSYDMERWNDYVYEDSEITDISFDDKNLYIHGCGLTITLRSSLITAADVPEGKVFLTQEGELAKGTAGNIFSSVLRTGLISSIEVEDKAFLNDPFTFDPREQSHAFNHIIHYGDEYLFAVGYLNKLIILRSRDGFTWTKGFETDNLNVNFINTKFNRWHFEVYEGKLFFIQNNITYTEAGAFRIEIYPDQLELIADNMVFWDRAEIADNFNLLFINPVSTGLLYGYYNEDPAHLDHLVIVDAYGINTLYDTPIEVSHIINISNRTDGSVIFSPNGFRVTLGEKIYENTSNVAHDDFKTMKALIYKDILIILQQSFNANIPFIGFYKLRESDHSVIKVEDNELPDEYRLFRRKPFLPIGDICNNLLIIDDYNCKETAFIVDLEDHFKIVKYEDDTDMNRNKFIQYCNGRIFTMNQFKKSKSIRTGNICFERDWVDMASSNHYYLTISADDQLVYCSKNGLEWKVLEAYANDGKIADRIVAGGSNIAIAYTGECEYVWVSADEGLTWKQMWFPWTFWIQNVEMIHTANGYELFIYAKLHEDDPYNVIFSTYDYETWNECAINAVKPSILTNEEWRDITCNPEGLWVAIDGSTSRVIYSLDGVEWTESVMPRKQEWSSVIYTPRGFFVIARHSIYAAYSTDGREWIELQMPTDSEVENRYYDWVTAAYGNVDGEDTLVVLSRNGLFATGKDIFTLNLHRGIANREWTRMVYQDNKFVAIASNSARGIYSLDGLEWEDMVLPSAANWLHLLYASGAFIAIDAECKTMATSINGITWLPEEVEDGKLYRFIDYQNDKFVIFQIEGELEKVESTYEYVGTSDTLKEWISGTSYLNGMVFTSVDGVIVNKPIEDDKWNVITLPEGTNNKQWFEYAFPDNLKWTNLCQKENKKVILGINTDKGVYSADGIQWHSITLPFVGEWIGVTIALNRFVAIAKNDDRFITSYDGIVWAESKLPVASDWIGMVYGNSKLYLYSGSTTTYYYTNNLIAWKECERDGRVWTSLTFDGSKFIGIVNGYSTAYISMDGLNWETNYIGYSGNWSHIVTCHGISFITERNSNVILYSEDGMNWTKTAVEDVNSDWEVVYLSDRYYLLGKETDIAFYSETGAEWTKVLLKYCANWAGGWKQDGIETTLSTYNLFAQNLGMIEYSYDGTYFYKMSDVEEILYGNGMFVVIDRALDKNGESVIYYTHDLKSWQTSRPKLNGKLIDLAYGDGRFMLITTRAANFAFESTDVVNWSLLPVSAKDCAEKIVYGPKGFLILEDQSSDILLLENSFGLKSYKLPGSMNAIVTSTGSVTIAYDINAGDFHISYNNRESWTMVNEVSVPNIDIGTLQGKSLSDVIVYYSYRTIYLYSILRDKWYVISTPFERILGFAELSVLTEFGNAKAIAVYDENHIAYINNASSLTGEIGLGELIETPAPIVQVVKNLDQNGYSLLYSDGTIDGKKINVEYDGISDIMTDEIAITKIVNNDGKYLAITNSNFYYTSNDFESWYRHEWPLELVPSYLEISQNHYVAILTNGFCTYFATSNDGEKFSYIDFVDTYQTEAILMTSDYNIFISKYGDTLDEIVLKEYYFLLNTVGQSKSKYDRVSPIRPAFAKGSFNVTESGEMIKINLSFTPSKVYVRSVLSGDDIDSSYIMISDDAIFHQTINETIKTNNTTLAADVQSGNIQINESNGARIVAYGFHVSPKAVGEYIYYAYN